MQAEVTRDGHPVGVFIMTRDGDYSWACHDDERERFEAVIVEIIEELREPFASVGYGDLKPVTYKPGDERWFDKVRLKLSELGYVSSIIDRD